MARPTRDEDARERRWRVGDADDGARLDVWLAGILGVGRRGIGRWIKQGLVSVDGTPASKGRVLRAGEEVATLGGPDPVDFDPVPDASVPLDVRCEHADWVVVEKAAGIAPHPLRTDDRGTLAQALIARYPEMQGVGYRRREPGLLHRLDVGTSGLILAARSDVAFLRLREDLLAGRIDKRYLALVVGEPEVGLTCTGRLESDPNHRSRVRVAPEGDGRPAKTRLVAARAIAPGWSLVEIETARALRHQIRAHLAAAGHPLAGDILYGGPRLDGLEHHFLHASRLAFAYNGRGVVTDAPLPDARVSILETLGREPKRADETPPDR